MACLTNTIIHCRLLFGETRGPVIGLKLQLHHSTYIWKLSPPSCIGQVCCVFKTTETCWRWNTRPAILLHVLHCSSFNHGIALCLSCLAFWSHCKTGFSVESATEKGDEHNFPGQEIHCHCHAHYRTFKDYESVAKRSPNCFFFRCNVICSTSCLHYLLPDRRDSFITDKLRNPKYFNNFQLKLLHFQAPLSRTDWTDINNRLLIDKWHYLKIF